MDLKSMMTQMHMGMPQHGPSGHPSGVSAPESQPIAAASKAPGNPVAHLKAAHVAAKVGDHAGAKKHALKAVNLLHKFAPSP